MSPTFGTSTILTHLLSTRSKRNEFVYYQFQGIAFPCMHPLGVAMVALVCSWFPSLQKKSNSLVLMVTLVKPPLGARLITPNPFVIQPISLVVSWFCVAVSPYGTTNYRETSQKTLNSLNVWSTFGLASFCISKNLSTFRHFRACLPPFSLSGPFKRKIKECTSVFNSEDKWKSMCSSNFSFRFKFFSFHVFFLGVVEVFFQEPTFPFLFYFE